MAEAAEKNAPETNAAPAAPKASRDLLSLILLTVVVLNLASVAGLGFFTMQLWGKVKLLNKTAEELIIRREAASVSPTGKETRGTPLGVLYPLESFLVNISSDTGSKFLQAQMELELEDPALEEEIAAKRPALRDTVIVMLSSRSYRDLREPSGLKSLRTDLVRAINNLLTSGKIKEIYFTQFHFN